MRGMFLTLKLCLEARIKRYMPVHHAIVPWLLEHASLILNMSEVGPDGFTAWARARGRGFNEPMFGFGEQVLYKLPSKGPMSKPDGNMGTKWLPGQLRWSQHDVRRLLDLHSGRGHRGAVDFQAARIRTLGLQRS